MGAFEERDWLRAEAEARVALSSSNDDRLRIDLMEALAAQGRFDEALETRPAIDTPRSLATQAACLLELGRRDEAIAAARLSLDSVQDDHRDFLVAGKLFRWLGMHQEALLVAQRAVLLAPTSPPTLTLLGQCLAGVDDDRAQLRLEQSVRLEPRQPEAWLALSGLALRRDDPTTAKAHAARAIELAPAWTQAQWAYNQASIKAQHRAMRWLLFALIPMLAAQLALAVSAASHWQDSGFLPRIAGSVVLLVVGIAATELHRRRRMHALERTDPSAAALERKYGVSGAELEGTATPSMASGLQWGARGLFGCAWFFGVGGLAVIGLVIALPTTRAFHPGMLVMAVPPVLAVFLWREAAKLREQAERARNDRS